MRDTLPPGAHKPPKRPYALTRLAHRWLRGHGWAGGENASRAFGARLFATVLLTFLVIGITGFVLLERDLTRRVIADYAAAQQADALAFEQVSVRAASPTDALGDVERLLYGVAQRAGTREAFVIDRQHVIRAAVNGERLGTTDINRRIANALTNATPYAGHEAIRPRTVATSSSSSRSTSRAAGLPMR